MSYKEKVTKGPAHAADQRTWHDVIRVFGGRSVQIAQVSTDGQRNDSDTNKANASLIAEAFNTLHETGYTPAELARAVRELTASIKELLPVWQSGIEEPWIERAEAILAKYQSVTP